MNSKQQHISSYYGSIEAERAALAVDDSFARYQEKRRVEQQRVAANRRRVAVAAGAAVIAVMAVAAGAEVVSVVHKKSHEIVVDQNANALKHAKGIVNGQLWISAGTHMYAAPDIDKDPAGERVSNAQKSGKIPEGGYSVINPLAYEMDGQDWYGFIDPTIPKSQINPAEKIHWVSGQALNVKDDNGHYLANWEGGLVPDVLDSLGFDKAGNPIDTSKPVDDGLSSPVAYVDNLPSLK